jgi:hypothetical protein
MTYVPGKNIKHPETPAPSVPTQILPGDMLPKTASLHPMFNKDAANPLRAVEQDPALAYAYGVYRNGSHVALQRPQAASVPAPPLETQISEMRPPFIQPSGKKEEKPSQGSGDELSIVEKEPEEPEDPIKYVDEPPLPSATDLAQLREQTIQVVHNSAAQRAIVEKRLKGKFDYASFLMNEPVRQTVVIRPGEFEVTFQSVPYEVELQLKRLVAEEAGGPVFDEYLLDKFHLMGLAASVYSINSTVLNDYNDAHGCFNPKLLEAKLLWILRKPSPLVVMLSVHYVWFTERMHRALQAIDPKAG